MAAWQNEIGKGNSMADKIIQVIWNIVDMYGILRTILTKTLMILVAIYNSP